MFQFAQSLLDYVLHRAERFYDEHCEMTDATEYYAGEFGPYYEMRDYGRVDWWDHCVHFKDALAFVLEEAAMIRDQREYRVRSINNRNPEYGVLRNAVR
jgi:hypothetical protein